MSKAQQLKEVIKECRDKSSWPHGRYDGNPWWDRAELMIQRMKAEDFIVAYDKDTVSESPLLMGITSPKTAYLAILIIKKNPAFAAKVITIAGLSTLNAVCEYVLQDEAFEIIDSLVPYLGQDALLRDLEHNGTFLHAAVKINPYSKEQNYKVAASMPPKLINVILQETVKKCDQLEKNHSSYEQAYSLIKYLYEAIHVWDMEISLHPERADNYFRKGVILQGIGKNEKALKCYKKAIQLDPKYAEKIEAFDFSINIEPEPKTIVEEHKGERADDAPPYEAPSVGEMALMGVEDTSDVIFHACS